MKGTLILGFGSTVLSDEGVVPQILEKLEQEFPKILSFRSELTLSLDLVAELSGYNNLLILDTIRVMPEETGSVSLFSLENYRPTLHLENMHDISFPEFVALADELGFKLPHKIHILAIGIQDNHTISDCLTKDLKDRFEHIFFTTRKIIQNYYLNPAIAG